MKIVETRIDLTNILFRARHGVEAREKEAGNNYRISLSVWPCGHSAMETDNVGETISYADLYEVVRHVVVEEEPSDLLEHVAGRILEELSVHSPEIARATVTITKVQPPIRGFNGDGASFTATATF